MYLFLPCLPTQSLYFSSEMGVKRIAAPSSVALNRSSFP